ncbi:MAG: anthranilate synthase component I [Candidatus Omnitrophica bacterium]|nr:anthranilate synthase component I [Candidatus Omnitrophota bacterium]
MFLPSFKEFKKKAKEANLIPVYKEVRADTETPVSAYLKLKSSKYSFLLESIEGKEKICSHSYIGISPKFIFRSFGKKITIVRDDRVIRDEIANPLHALKKFLRQFHVAEDTSLPRFIGGAVGYLSYDMVRFMESIPEITTDDLLLPDSIFIVTRQVIIFDHLNHTMKIVALVEPHGDIAKRYKEAESIIEKTISKLNRQLSPEKSGLSQAKIGTDSEGAEWNSNFTRKKFIEAVGKVKEYIRAGDIVQAVISQRYNASVKTPPFHIYRALRHINPSPFMYYLDYGKIKLIGASPEIMLRREGDTVEVRPIAGTRRRGKTEEEDTALAKELFASPKERAEHIMLVDLGRNDLGRVSRYGSVKVGTLMSIERYSHVMHLVSDVVGKLAKGKDEFDALVACFPAGTVSGAPKIRAMEIIEELEPTRRGPYAGAVGYFSFTGNLDTCITIRTIVMKDNQAYIQAGAGIVADSDPAFEYEETKNKARAMMEAVKMANGTIL